jgi:GNAT superfamily N-acetyltransferase
MSSPDPRTSEPLTPAQPLRAEQVRATAELLARALDDDPAYAYLMPDPARRQRGLADFFSGNLHAHLRYRCTHIALDPTGHPSATVTLRPPDGVHLTPQRLMFSLAGFALRHGPGAVRRLMWLKHTYDALELAASSGAPHRYVHMMAVHPERQGRGEGGRLLADVLDLVAATGPRVPAVLTTHRERNVVFYRRAGFEVTSERTLNPPGGTPYVVWSMARA